MRDVSLTPRRVVHSRIYIFMFGGEKLRRYTGIRRRQAKKKITEGKSGRATCLFPLGAFFSSQLTASASSLRGDFSDWDFADALHNLPIFLPLILRETTQPYFRYFCFPGWHARRTKSRTLHSVSSEILLETRKLISLFIIFWIMYVHLYCLC